jgi:cell wall-associated NlpC family hydrolase
LKKLFYLLFLFVFLSSCKSSSAKVSSTSKKDENKTSALLDKIIHSASENIGIRYKIAGTTKSGYDCSGLIYTLFDLYNIKLPRTSLEQSKTGVVLEPNVKNAKKGDLIFFKTNKNSQINHVGIVVEVNDNGIKFIHSSTSNGVIISSTKEPYYQNTFAQLNRILD